MLLLFQDSLKFLPEYLDTVRPDLDNDDLFILVQKLLIAILIGALIGLEREYSRPSEEKTFAGVRTFPLISILGFIAALISSITSFWIYFSIFLGFASLVTIAHIFSAKQGRLGGTSEISILLVFILGSLVYWNYIILAAIIAVIVATFLTLKFQLHSFVGKISKEDLYATIKLAIITVIVLPLLPDSTIGPLDILNPRMIWLMVIFITGISFIGYIFIKVFGGDKGIPITGLMGGLVSSTAVTFSLSKKSAESKIMQGNFAAGIVMASTVMFPRVFLIILAVNSTLAGSTWLPLFILTVTGIIISYLMMKKINGTNEHENIEIKNPFKLKSALLFGLIFAVVIFISKAAQIYLGNSGIYAASTLGGLTSVDAIILSLAQLTNQDLSSDVAVAAVLLAIITNTIVKIFIAVIWGASKIRKYIITSLGGIALVAVFYLIFIII